MSGKYMAVTASRLRLAVLLALVGWAYWTTLQDVARRWTFDPLYSHGWLVPAFAALLLWLRKDMLQGAVLHPSLWGLTVVAAAAAMRVVPLWFGFSVLDRYSLIPTLCGVCLAAGGWAALRWAWPAICFLVFMLHLPAGLDQWLANPLQRVATLASTNALQTLGFFAEAEGNVILLSDSELGVVEACSGLRMFVTFCAMTTAVAVLMKRSWIQKVIVVASALPLAMICNIARITLTGVVRETLGERMAQLVFHDLAGWLMIVLALALLGLEMFVLGKLFVPIADSQAALVGARSGPAEMEAVAPGRSASRAPAKATRR